MERCRPSRIESSEAIASTVNGFFAVDSIAIFDLELNEIDVSGPFPLDAKEMARNTCYFEMNQDYDDLNLSRRVLYFDTGPIGALLIGGKLDLFDQLQKLRAWMFAQINLQASSAQLVEHHHAASLGVGVPGYRMLPGCDSAHQKRTQFKDSKHKVVLLVRNIEAIERRNEEVALADRGQNREDRGLRKPPVQSHQNYQKEIYETSGGEICVQQKSPA
jgi:hypothetical protein